MRHFLLKFYTKLGEVATNYIFFAFKIGLFEDFCLILSPYSRKGYIIFAQIPRRFLIEIMDVTYH